MKKSVGLILLLLVGLSLFVGIASVSAADDNFFTKNVINPIKNVFTNEDANDISLNTVSIRLFFFALIAVLIFSILTTSKFPEQGFVRVIISAIVSFLAIVYITPDEFYAIVQSYTALGIALSVFIPIMILIFFTLTIGEKAAFALVFTRALWAVYSIYIFWKGLVIYTVLDNGGVAPGWLISLYSSSNVTTGTGTTAVDTIVEGAVGSSLIVGIALMVAGAIVFYFGAVNHSWMNFFKEEMTKSQIESYKEKVRRSTGFIDSNAEAVEGKK